LPRYLPAYFGGRDIFVITDSTVRTLYGVSLTHDLTKAGYGVWLLDIPAGERSKTPAVVQTLQNILLSAGIRRNSLIIALGGGVVGDVAGFVAATILRGVDYIQVPTTLIAQADSSIGGKVGVNHARGKNLIGAFYPPRAVFTDPEVIKTLPRSEFRNGLAEILKIALALDPRLFSWLERNRLKLRVPNVRQLTTLIRRAVNVKAKVVQQDERDVGARQVLNLGHTVAHALEKSTDHKIPHGAAVAIGIAVESEISVRMGVMWTRERVRLMRLMRELRLPVNMPPISNSSAFLRALSLDKKGIGRNVRFVLPRGIGRASTCEVPPRLITEVLGQPKAHK
jgi:3-dehydroquinate synthase